MGLLAIHSSVWNPYLGAHSTGIRAAIAERSSGNNKPGCEGWRTLRGPVEAIWEEEHPKPEVGEASRKGVRGQWRRRWQSFDSLAEKMLEIISYSALATCGNHKKSRSLEGYTVPYTLIEPEFVPSGRKGEGREWPWRTRSPFLPLLFLVHHTNISLFLYLWGL